LNDLIAACVSEEEHHKKGKAESAHFTVQSCMKNLFINTTGKKNFTKGGFKKNENQKRYQKENSKITPPKNNNSAPGSENTCFFCKKEGHIKKNCNGYKAWLAKKGGIHNKVSDQA